MDWVDVILVLFLIVTAILGIRRGLARMLIPLIGLIVGVVVAGRYYDALAHRIFLSHSTIAYIVAFVIIVMAFFIASAFLAIALQKTLSLIPLAGWVDRLGGAFFGLVIGSLIAGAVLALLLKCSVAVPIVKDSAVATFLVDRFPVVLSLLPGDFHQVKDFFR